ncbi:hypothetical protein U91I_03715 [alpha proteobacterium U9-1i]|nr:hypothetical protein U91I_03715 [alpha proteobacterium U9-1i]
MKKPDGRRDLSLVRASGSTARVLNLPLIAERHGETDEYKQKPLFKNKHLNRALILKHTLRQHERDLFDRPVSCATKVILPYASGELGLGGVSVLVGERRYERMLAETSGGGQDPVGFEQDLDLLRLLGTLPSFDPFLMRERLRHSGVEPARCYFDIAEADVARMRAFVSAEISQLIDLAFATGGRSAGDLSAKLADKLMTDETAKSLDPLRQTLRLSGAEYVEGVFAWKGFLYYKWLMREIKPALENFAPRFSGCRILRATPDEKRDMAETRQRILALMKCATDRVDALLLQYGVAFAALADGQAGAFRDFLLKAPSMFIPIGEAVGVIRHVDSFWRFRFPDAGMPMMEADEAMEIFHEFELTLNGVEFVRKPATIEAAA